MIIAIFNLVQSLYILNDADKIFLLFTKIRDEHRLFYLQHFKRLSEVMIENITINKEISMENFMIEEKDISMVNSRKMGISKIKGYFQLKKIIRLGFLLFFPSLLVFAFLRSQHMFLEQQCRQMYNQFDFFKNFGMISVHSSSLFSLIEAKIAASESTTHLNFDPITYYPLSLEMFKQSAFSLTAPIMQVNFPLNNLNYTGYMYNSSSNLTQVLQNYTKNSFLNDFMIRGYKFQISYLRLYFENEKHLFSDSSTNMSSSHLCLHKGSEADFDGGIFCNLLLFPYSH